MFYVNVGRISPASGRPYPSERKRECTTSYRGTTSYRATTGYTVSYSALREHTDVTRIDLLILAGECPLWSIYNKLIIFLHESWIWSVSTAIDNQLLNSYICTTSYRGTALYKVSYSVLFFTICSPILSSVITSTTYTLSTEGGTFGFMVDCDYMTVPFRPFFFLKTNSSLCLSRSLSLYPLRTRRFQTRLYSLLQSSYQQTGFKSEK